MNEHTRVVIELLRETLREIEEYSDAEKNQPADKLKGEFRRMIGELEIAREDETRTGKPATHPSASIP